MKNELENNLLMFFFLKFIKRRRIKSYRQKIWRMTLKNNNFINYFK
jgi:hypothetical protein